MNITQNQPKKAILPCNYIVGWEIVAEIWTRKRFLVLTCLTIAGLVGLTINWFPVGQEAFLTIALNVNGFFLLLYLSLKWIKIIADKVLDLLYALKRLKRCVKEWSE